MKKKLEAENAAKKVIGVKALVENIEVKFPSNWVKSDLEVAKEVLTALRNRDNIPKDKVTVKVEKGWITLEGELSWNYQKEGAKDAVKYLMGVKGVTNNIKIKPETHDAIEKKDVENAIHRNWSVDDRNIHVSVSGTTVTLTGTVKSWYQKEEAGNIAWKTSGIWDIKKRISNSVQLSFSQLIRDNEIIIIKHNQMKHKDTKRRPEFEFTPIDDKQKAIDKYKRAASYLKDTEERDLSGAKHHKGGNHKMAKNWTLEDDNNFYQLNGVQQKNVKHYMVKF